jgi:hypothetical protein
MALDVYSTPACSDEPERIFSEGGALLAPRRCQLTGDHVQEILCLKSWQRSGIITLDDSSMFEQAVRHADGEPIGGQLDTSNTADSSDEVL